MEFVEGGSSCIKPGVCVCVFGVHKMNFILY